MPTLMLPQSHSGVTPLSEVTLLLVGRLFGDSQELPRESFRLPLPSLLLTKVSSIALSNEGQHLGFTVPSMQYLLYQAPLMDVALETLKNSLPRVTE